MNNIFKHVPLSASKLWKNKKINNEIINDAKVPKLLSIRFVGSYPSLDLLVIFVL